ncbi:MAG: DNA-3-methyladenine glycosylase [bacterium]
MTRGVAGVPGWMRSAAPVAAPRLLGSMLVSDLGGARVAVRITEVEAYGGEGEDPGSHAYRGRTPRNAVMFGPAGDLYVYFTYGMHWCSNVVVGREGSAAAVLLRAGEVVAGLEAARDRRPSARSDRDLARGPARLAASLGLTAAANGLQLFDPGSPVRLEVARRPLAVHAVTPRTGVSGEGAPTPWRYAADHPSVSPYRPAPPLRHRARSAPGRVCEDGAS